MSSITRQQLAVTVGETIKLSLYNLKLREELREQAIHDPLTGLCNRRYLDESLSRELHRAQRGKSPLCVVMLDLDTSNHSTIPSGTMPAMRCYASWRT